MHFLCLWCIGLIIIAITDDSVSKLDGDVHEIDKDNSFKVNDNAEDVIDKENVEVNKKKEKSTTSEYWKFFTKIGPGEDGKERAQCNGYNKKYIVGSKKYATSHLKRHVEKCSKIKFEDES